MTEQGEVRDWQKDMELCQSLNDWYEGEWQAGQEDGSRIIEIYEIVPDEPFNFVAECDSDLTTEFVMESRKALPYWLVQAAEWKAEAAKTEIKAAAEKERADKEAGQAELWREYVRKSNLELEATEAREKKLREAIEEALSWTWDCGENNMTEVISILRSAIYPLEKEEEAR